MEEVTIRSAVSGDLTPIISFQLAMALETEQLLLQPEVVELGVRAVFDDPSKGCYYVAESEERVIGSLLTTYEWSDWRNGTILWIQSVYVLPQFRRLGVYRKLYSHIKEMVVSDPKLMGIRLYADKSNVTAHSVYHNLEMVSDHYLTFEWMK